MSKKRFVLLFLALFHFFLFPVLVLSASHSQELYPVYDSIKDNVAFWEKVYAVYPSTKGIIHDSRDLSVIYEVIDLVPKDKENAGRLNKKRVKAVKEKYRDILLSLAAGEKADTEEMKRVRELWKGQSARFREAAGSLRFQLCQKDRFEAGLIRSGAFFEQMKEIFTRNGLPEDLAYLPHVESSFNYKAYSKFGAAGVWQFTRGTGKRFMTVDYTLDERRDAIVSTHAAARYLKENYQKLGNWPLALTAYNHGANGMMRAQKKIGGYEKIFNEYKSRTFGFASRNFYAEFLAARTVAKNYRQHFGELQMAGPVDVHEVTLSGFAPIKELSRHFQVDLVTLRELNPALRPPVFQGHKYVPKGYRLRLPANNGHMKKLAAAFPDGLFAKHQKRSRFYQVERGDIAGNIARKHGVKLQDLLLANGLGRSATIYAGQNLRIPSTEEKVVLLAGAVPEKKSRQQAPKVLTARPKQKPAPAEPVTPAVADISPSVVVGNIQVEQVRQEKGRFQGIIRVEVGETLGHFADWLQVPTSALRRLNGLAFGRSLKLDQRLKVEFAKVKKDEFEEKRYEFHKEIEEDFFAAYKIEGAMLYRIKPGDTSWKLCHEEFDLPFWLIRKYNSAHDFNNLKRDEQLIVPVVGKIDA